jgi:NAD(P)-dependent dehydrogenase (short-subunit alcohol dehydrogenase family)
MSTAKGTIVVTGAASGIGRATALRLARGGHRVLAGVRRESDGDELAAAAPDGTLEPLLLDVTDAGHLAALGERLAGVPLTGLVNNAGIAVTGPLEAVELDEVRRQFEVNLVGQLAVTQTALPALRAGVGRIVNVGSIGGRVGPPFIGPYASSKGALRTLTASLRRELAPWGIHVALIEPGAIATEIWRKGLEGADEQLAALPERARELYGPQMEALRKATVKIAGAAIPAERVAQDIEHALTAARPRPLYTVGTEARVQATLNALLPARVFDRLIARAMGL